MQKYANLQIARLCMEADFSEKDDFDAILEGSLIRIEKGIQVKEAIEMLRDAMQRHPFDSNLLGLLARALFLQGEQSSLGGSPRREGSGTKISAELEESFGVLQRAIQVDPQNASHWNTAGIVYQRAGQARAALEAYLHAVELDPFLAEPWWNLAGLYLECNGAGVDSREAFSRANSLKRANDPRIFFNPDTKNQCPWQQSWVFVDPRDCQRRHPNRLFGNKLVRS